MNQENSSENTVESTETNPDEVETCQDKNNQAEESVNEDPTAESANEVNENVNQVIENVNQVNENENQVSENNQVIENESQDAEKENQVAENPTQSNDNENEISENENHKNENADQVNENEKQCSAECEVAPESIPKETATGENFESNDDPEPNTEPNTEPSTESNTEPSTEPNTEPTTEPNTEPNTEENPLEAVSEANTKVEADDSVKPEIQGTDSQQPDSSLTQSPKDKAGRNQKRGHKNSKAVNCDKYGWPIGSKYCTEVNDSANEVNFADDVDLANCESKVSVDDPASQESPSPDEEILYVVKSPSHRTANSKRTILNVEEVEGAITDGIQAGTHFPHFLNYLSLQVKFKFTLARLPDGKLRITFRFVGKGGESLKDIICVWLRRNDEDKDKIFCEGLTRNKEATLSLLARKFHEMENLKEDIVPLYEEVKKLVPEFRGKEGLRSEDEAFLEGYRNLDNKLLVLVMLLFKDNCEIDDDSQLLSKFRDLYFSLQMSSGFTVKQYLHVIYCYNMIFAPYLPQELEEMVKKYALMKNITLPDSPPLIIPPCGQKSKWTVINPFAMKKLQNSNQDDNLESTFETIPIKTDGAELPTTEQLAEPAKKNAPKKRQTNRKNRKSLNKKNNESNAQNPKSPQGQRSNLQNTNPRNQFNNRFPRNRQNLGNQRENSFRPRNPRNFVGPRNQGNVGNFRNQANKRQQGIQGGPPAKKRNVNQGSVNRDTLPNPVTSADPTVPENVASPRNQSAPNQRNQQNMRNRPRTRPRRKNGSNQQTDHPRNNQQTPRNNLQNPRNNLQNPRNNLQNPRNNLQNPRNNVQNPRNNQQNPRNNLQNPRNNLQNPRNNVQNPRNNQQNQRNQPNSRNEKNNSTNERNNQPRNSRPRRRPDSRKRPNSDHYFGMSDVPSRNQGFSSSSSSSNNHEFLLNSLRNQNLMQSNMRNQDMGRNQNFNNDRSPMFSQSNSRQQNFSQDNAPRHNNFPQSNHQPRSLFAQQFFDMPRNQNFGSNNSGNQNFSQSNSRRPWSDFAGNSQNYFSGSNNFPNRSNSMNRNLGEFSNNFNSRMSFDDDMHAHNFINSNNRNWDNDFNLGKRKNMRDDWNSKRSKQ